MVIALNTKSRNAVAAAALTAMVLALEWTRHMVAALPGLELGATVVGGFGLCGLGLTSSRKDLGISRDRLAFKVAAGLGLGLLLVLPAVARAASGPFVPPTFALAAVVVSIGEEVAFRGVLYCALRRLGGSAVAVGGSTVVFVLAHIGSHPLPFLLPVAAMGLLLACWRWAFDDLVAPIVAHMFADLAW